jgi:hypothetical protein
MYAIFKPQYYCARLQILLRKKNSLPLQPEKWNCLFTNIHLPFNKLPGKKMAKTCISKKKCQHLRSLHKRKLPVQHPWAPFLPHLLLHRKPKSRKRLKE